MAYVYNGSMTLQRQATSETFLGLVIGTVVEDSGMAGGALSTWF